jgi:hypothetical protein
LLRSVTAGCPRVGDKKFRKVMMKKMALLKPLNRAVICRCVYNNDIVPHAPPNVLNFHHLDKMVYITKNGDNVIINPNMSKIFTKFGELQKIYSTIFSKKKEEVTENVKEVTENVKDNLDKAQDTIHEIQDNIVDNVGGHNSNQQRIGSGAAASDVVAAVAKGNAEEEKTAESSAGEVAAAVAVVAEKTAFEIECENTIEAIHDHMPFWYMTFLEKIRDEQKALFSSDDDAVNDTAAATPTPTAAATSGGGNDHESDVVTDTKDKEDPAKKESAPQETELDGDDGVEVAAC